MSTGTKIFLAIAAVVVTLLALYYGLGGSGDEPELAAATPPADAADPAARPAPAARDPLATPGARPAAGRRGVLGDTVASVTDPTSAGGFTPRPTPAGRGDASSRLAPAFPLFMPGTSASPAAATTGPPAGIDRADRVAMSPIGRDEPRAIEPAPRYTAYRVKRRDTFTSIAEDWFGDGEQWTLIAEANPRVDPRRMRIGQELRLPPREGGAAAAPRPRRDGGGERIYTVRSGDTLSEIAVVSYGSSRRWRDIFDANRSLIGSDPDALEVGMRLVIP
ncbi:MAG: LysM peptidoglycan-binding domain-containing protein [Planctomycetota bacterium]|jgi:nucleoid-associated protein YgaU